MIAKWAAIKTVNPCSKIIAGGYFKIEIKIYNQSKN